MLCLLSCRYLSVSRGFTYLSEVDYVEPLLAAWKNVSTCRILVTIFDDHQYNSILVYESIFHSLSSLNSRVFVLFPCIFLFCSVNERYALFFIGIPKQDSFFPLSLKAFEPQFSINFVPIEKRAYISEHCKCCSWWRQDDLVSSYARDSTVY